MVQGESPDAGEALERAWAGLAAAVLGVALGQETGLLAELASGPATADEVAARAGTDPRMTLEWLRVMVVSGFATHADGVFGPAEGLDRLTDVPDGQWSQTDLFTQRVRRDLGLLGHLGEAVRTGAGVPHELYEPLSSRSQDLYNGRILTKHLVDGLLAPVPGLLESLADGCSVLDVGCGAGRALATLAEAYPRSRYTGYDLDTAALDLARERLAALPADAAVERRDVRDLPVATFDVVLAVDTIHDLGDPQGTLEAIRRALRPGGVFVMCETDASGDFEVDRTSEAAWEYYVSLSMCIPVSQASGGPGLGSLWGRAGALPMLERAGFSDVTVRPSEVGYAVYACRA